MTTKQQDQPKPDLDSQERKQFLNALGQQVMQTLGRPSDLQTVQVRRLWGDCYRVNVFVGADLFARIAHSYFLTIDGQGQILTSVPAVTKVY